MARQHADPAERGARAAPPPAVDRAQPRVLALQRQIGNRAVARLVIGGHRRKRLYDDDAESAVAHVYNDDAK